MASDNLTRTTASAVQLIKNQKNSSETITPEVVITQIHLPGNTRVPTPSTQAQKPPERVEKVGSDGEKSIGLSFHIRPIQKETVLLDRTLPVTAEKFLMNETIIFDPVAKKMLQTLVRRLHRIDIRETKKVSIEIASMGAYGCTDSLMEKRIIEERSDEKGNRKCSLIESLAFLIQWEPQKHECACIHMDPVIDESSEFFPLIFIKEKIHPPDHPTRWLTRIDVAYAYPWGKWGRGVQWVMVKK